MIKNTRLRLSEKLGAAFSLFAVIAGLTRNPLTAVGSVVIIF